MSVEDTIKEICYDLEFSLLGWKQASDEIIKLIKTKQDESRGTRF